MRPVAGTRLVYAPLLLGVALIVATFLVAESGHSRLRDATVVVAESQRRQALLSRYMQLLLEAETAQRGFLLTEETRYLREFDPAVKELDPLLDQITASYEASALEPSRRNPANCASSPACGSAKCWVRCASTASRTSPPRWRSSTPTSARRRWPTSAA